MQLFSDGQLVVFEGSTLMGKIDSLLEDIGYETHSREEDDAVIEEMLDDPEIKTIIKLVVAGMSTPEMVAQMIDEIHFRALDTVRRKALERDDHDET